MAEMPRYDTGENDLVAQASTLLQTELSGDIERAVCCMAPGRVNLIGEHTDYNEGFVMPMALNLQTVVVAVPTTSGLCRVASVNQPGNNREFRISEIAPGSVHGWGKYVAGVIAQYHGDLPGDRPFSFDAAFASNVPLGAGLSSSASLEVGLTTHIPAFLYLYVVQGVSIRVLQLLCSNCFLYVIQPVVQSV
jgi:galactokinase